MAITWAAADLVGALLTGQPDVRGLLYLAVGAGEESWDDEGPPPDPSRTRLTAEVARVPLVPGKHLTFDPATSTVHVAVTVRQGLAPGPLREMGLFGGRASHRRDSGTLVSHRVHERIDNGTGERLQRRLDVVLGVTLPPGARLTIGSLLARREEATGLTYVGFGSSNAEEPTAERLEAEHTRLPLAPGAVRYRPDHHAVDVEVALDAGQGPPQLAEVGVFGGPATRTVDTGWLFSRDVFAEVDRTTARRFHHRLRLTLVSATDLPVPDVTGQLLVDARAMLLDAGLQAGTVTTEETADEAPDQVLRQSLAPQTPVAEATRVDLLVSTLPRVPVPAVVGLSLARATEVLGNAQLTAAEPPQERVSADLAPGTVLAADPPPGARVPIGTAVTLVVAVAPPVVVADVRGRSRGSAGRVLEAQGLTVAEPVGETPSGATPGTVVSQQPAGGAEVPVGSSVALTLAVPVTVAAPDLTGLTLDGARAALAEAGAALLPEGVRFPPGLDIGAHVEQPVDRDEATGRVLSQAPEAGAPLALYATVDVVVGAPAPVVVPDLHADPLATAGKRLAGAGLRLGRVGAQRSAAPAGTVVAQSPAAGAQVEVDDPVAVWLATGAVATVPLVVHLSLDAAHEALEVAGLTAKVVTTSKAIAPAGEVLAQSPAYGVQVPAGSAVTLTIAAVVPALVGLPVDDARKVAEAVQVNLRETLQASKGPAGIVLSQSPAAGSPSTSVRFVDVKVSAPVATTVPDVQGKTLDDATTALAAKGLGVAVRSRPVDAEKAGLVVGQDPAAGASAPTGSVVQVDVAQEPVKAVAVPDVRKGTQAAAAAALAQVGLMVGKVTEKPSRAAPGTVIAQDPAPGVVVPSGSAVALVLATAEGAVDVPDVRGLSAAKAEAKLDAAGLGMAVDRLELSAKPIGTVLDQAPRPGTAVPVATTVAVVLATHKKPGGQDVPPQPPGPMEPLPES